MNILPQEQALYQLHNLIDGARNVLEEVELTHVRYEKGLQSTDPIRKDVMKRHRISNFVSYVTNKVKTDAGLRILLAGIVIQGASYVTTAGANADMTALDLINKATTHILQGNVSFAHRYLEELSQVVSPDNIAEYLKRRALHL